MIETATVETFRPHIGDRFRMGPASGPTLDAELIEATKLRDATGDGRAPFSLVFRGPDEPVLPQRIYPLEHDDLGEIEIFLVPVGPDDDGMRYEAVFS